MEKFKDYEYVRPDIDDVNKGIAAAAKALASAADYAQARRALLDGEKFKADYDTRKEIATIRNSLDTTDTFYENEMRFYSEADNALVLSLRSYNEALASSSFADALSEEFGELVINCARAQLRLLDERTNALKLKEDDLVLEYSKITSGCEVDFHGEPCNFYGLLKMMQNPDRTIRREAMKAWSGMYESISGKLDDIYDKLVHNRVRQAQILGFESYEDMRFCEMSRFDYTKEDIAVFREEIVHSIVPLSQKLFEAQRKRLGIDQIHFYDETIANPEGNALPHGTADEMKAQARQMYHELSPETGDFFEFMMEHELFDLETRTGKQMGGYCTLMHSLKAPFIFSNFNGTSADVEVLTHEAGHAFQAYTTMKDYPLHDFVFPTSEACEIYSSVMELFTFPWMDKFFGGKSALYCHDHICEAFVDIPYLVCVDEFQQHVYEDPDMGAAGRRALWKKLEHKYLPWRDYDGDEFLTGGGFWMQKMHIFLCPFYYVDYALAELSAFELYLRSVKNREAAWNDYMKICHCGGMSYFEIMKAGNLSNPFEKGSVSRIADAIFEHVNRIKDI